MSRRRGIGAVLVIVGLMVLLAPVGAALSSLVLPDGDAPEPPAAGRPEPGPAIPTLSEAQRARAQELLGSDPQADRFLQGRDYRVAELGPWTTEDGRVIGASMVVRLSSPASFEMSRWPAIEQADERAGGRSYRESTLQMAADDVSELMVRVDLERQAVVSVEPSDPAAKITPGPDVKRTQPADPGY